MERTLAVELIFRLDHARVAQHIVQAPFLRIESDHDKPDAEDQSAQNFREVPGEGAIE
jgi:hypothetical protein